MAQTYLLDTCIWRDFYENRISKSGKPFGQYAAELIMDILKRKEKILFSKALIWELKKRYEQAEIHNLLNILFLNNILVQIDITKDEHKEAKQLSAKRNIPFVDCLNAIHARNHKAILVSQDLHYIRDLSDIAKPVKPGKLNN